ncbi:MAG: aminotransferase class III-fold pyridoxal phosphate-dependent enzyme [Armatimonadota bacterium]|nr:aminotransferase class III-fold pyridoxal phosphate-dependent enzyme [Armatimonadota bacterium]MDR7443495.1 aminotransferase class III-fold pyridoxal phosphate-dependent enzyme [Armatimonadota bacterium]MDR7569334.1 aminotransferase class III-fold pyridoxal phosphate-dependent enzyme [Armatimonadota bacterium]MDR7614994.1 aminotransferase class III-fold pyridoxal phosphate-dependent enzyme [Armatimonadota bacterium]
MREPAIGTADLVEDTFRKYAEHVNPGLVKLWRFAGIETLEWEAEGAVVRDVHGREYLDFSGGPAVFVLGHRHPRVVQAVVEQIQRMPMSVRALPRRSEAELAALLAEITPGDLRYAFFCNSGAEAVEGAIKLARLATGKPGIIATEGAFHGKTLGALSATGREKYRKPFEPLVPGFRHIPFGDPEALEEAIDGDTAAFLVEPIQAEGGVRIPPDDYLGRVREICDRRGILLIVDEVQTGMGRTGRMFACEHAGITPDILTLAKGLGGGVMPIGAFVARPHLWEAFATDPYLHSSTFGGNPAACAAAIATIRVLLEERLPERAADLGAFLLEGLRSLADRYPDLVREVRGKGLLLGVEFVDPDVALLCAAEALRRGVIFYFALNRPEVIRIAPPLVITREQIGTALACVDAALGATREMLESLRSAG